MCADSSCLKVAVGFNTCNKCMYPIFTQGGDHTDAADACEQGMCILVQTHVDVRCFHDTPQQAAPVSVFSSSININLPCCACKTTAKHCTCKTTAKHCTCKTTAKHVTFPHTTTHRSLCKSCSSLVNQMQQWPMHSLTLWYTACFLQHRQTTPHVTSMMPVPCLCHRTTTKHGVACC